MRDSHRNAMRRKLLTAAIAPMLASALTPAAAAIPLPVTDCGDGADSGTLRNVIAGAASGNVVDVSLCSTITLDTGKTSILIDKDDLTIQNASGATTIDASQLPSGAGTENRVLTHTGSGTLRLSHVNLTGGHVELATGKGAYGGCLYSKGHVEVAAGTLTSCSAYSTAPEADGVYARGGAIYANLGLTLTDSAIHGNTAKSKERSAAGGGVLTRGDISISHSVISGNSAEGGTYAYGGSLFADNAGSVSDSTISGNTAYAHSGQSFGGGADVVNGPLTVSYSTFTGNSAAAADGAVGNGGGIFVSGSTTLRRSTISANHASNIGGLAAASPYDNTNELLVVASTVSGNVGDNIGGGIGSTASSTKIYNSTIAFNSAGFASANDALYAPGLALIGRYTAMTVTLSSTLIANNTYGAGFELDLTTVNGDAEHTLTFAAGSANNLVGRAYTPGAIDFPGDTLAGSCPRLGPLRDNGGPTWTHALLSGSPGLNAGSNVLDLLEDQRGNDVPDVPHPFPRVLGATADIGAYEYDPGETVFAAGFDGCPPLD